MSFWTRFDCTGRTEIDYIQRITSNNLLFSMYCFANIPSAFGRSMLFPISVFGCNSLDVINFLLNLLGVTIATGQVEIPLNSMVTRT